MITRFYYKLKFSIISDKMSSEKETRSKKKYAYIENLSDENETESLLQPSRVLCLSINQKSNHRRVSKGTKIVLRF